MMISMFQRAKSVPVGDVFKTNQSSLVAVQAFDVDVPLSAICEFRRNRIASKRIPSRVV